MKIKYVGGAHATASDKTAIKKGLELGFKSFKTRQKLFIVEGDGISRKVTRQVAEKDSKGEVFLARCHFDIEVQ